MLYLNDDHIRKIGTDWHTLTETVRGVLYTDDAGDCVHPIKPYLRFREPQNRIIAMPAYVGGSTELAGIKWIASFPENYLKGLPRAHNTVILNDTDTGQPLAFFNSGLLSGLRTAAVSGLMVQAFMEARQPEQISLGIIGWGPIGRLHLDMCAALLGEKLHKIYLYDLRGVELSTVPDHLRSKTVVAQDWREVYHHVNILATCTVSSQRYIDEKPRDGMLLLGVSLRDYLPESVAHLKTLIVDDWDEVCRENTDIEQLHLQHDLQKKDVGTLADAVCRGLLNQAGQQETVFFNPMGLAIFDIGTAGHYWRKALALGIGEQLLV
ncbi:2,3-diaminopropionate biosynthesis protein SbnB [Paenibacillus lemnae]|uniref:2,3-diaminopropionate biosynthesis protein SbnB n=1 Tax=Paenibacillus lemnae TaxID=1330551 RepID=A0A848M7A0_PAELE|nr:2,3-diaminopropionate biosynthesis protein SbnB [Paenibacillus lemnae]NMO96070.1 2,3-diaminopropionate biosynthesis protein SbnB [Paenibacillus lemnae]